MRILVVHNDYGKYSGEESVVDRFLADYAAAGYEVETLRRTSRFSRETLRGKMHGFVSALYSVSGVRMMREAIREFRPDVIHVHNLYPFISPAALFACRNSGAVVIMTIHNYRLACPTGLFLRDGIPCEKCLQNGNERDCWKYNCEGSRLRTLGFMLRNWVARKSGAYRKCVDYYCCLTEFQKQKLIEAGYPAEKMRVFPNYISSTNETVAYQPSERTFVGFVGRLSEEKGSDLLIEVARRHPEIPFRFAGSFRDDVQPPQYANITYCGQLNQEQLKQFYSEVRFVAMPSRFYEGFPIVLLELLSQGIPCVVPNHGCYPELVEHDGRSAGCMFKALDVDALEEAVVALWNDPQRLQQYGNDARYLFDTRFSKEIFITRWSEFLTEIVGDK